MAGRGTDIMLGGNPEYLAKSEMRKIGIEEGLIAMATSSAPSEDAAVNEVRAIFRDLYNKHRDEIAPEADKVRAAGGLFILGTERHESRRIDNQLRGRSGRQGDPGESRFFLSLEDDLMRLFGTDRVASICDKMGFDENTPIAAGILSNSIESAQKRIEDNNLQRRKNVLTYDDVMNQQREVIYKQRRSVLDGMDISETLKGWFAPVMSEMVLSFEDSEGGEYNYSGLLTSFVGSLLKGSYSEDDIRAMDTETLSANAFLDAVNAVYGFEEFMKAVELWKQEEPKN
jgi:preprotein translocase subunit SecA